MASAIQMAGSQGVKQTSWAPIFTNRFMFGLVTNRNPLRSPAGIIYENYYRIGGTDTLIDGQNTEVTPRLTIARRPGTTAGLTDLVWSGNIPTPPLAFYSFRETNDVVRVITDLQTESDIVGGSPFNNARIPIFAKSASGGRGYYQGVNQSLYISDPVENVKWLDYGSGNRFTTTASEIVFGPYGSYAILTVANTCLPGQNITVSGSTNGSGVINGNYTVATATPTQITFTIVSGALAQASDTATITVYGNPGNGFAYITNSAASGGIATITALNSFGVGQRIAISNSTNGSGALNGFYTVLQAAPTFFTFAFTGSISLAADTGYACGIWNWQMAAPTVAPTLSIEEVGDASQPWVASTVFSTMGFIVVESPVDSTDYILQLTGVNANGLNPDSQIGTSGNGQPQWNQASGGLTTDNDVSWKNVGQISLWTANSPYTATQPIYDPVTGGIYVVWGTFSGTKQSGPTRPSFSGIVSSFAPDVNFQWRCIANIQNNPKPNGSTITNKIYTWLASFAYQVYDTGTSACVEPNALPSVLGSPLPTTPLYLQIVESNTGTSGTGYTPQWSNIPGNSTLDGELSWATVCKSAWQPDTAMAPWTAGQQVYSAILDPNGNIEVCIQVQNDGKTGGTEPTFKRGDGASTAYGDTTTDNNVTWVCVGPPVTWSTGQNWYLPAAGFFPPVPNGTPYGGANILDSNGNVEYVIVSGTSGSSAPSWPGTAIIGAQTTDNTITWVLTAASNLQGLAFSQGYQYCYAFKSRGVTDVYAPQPLGGGINLGQPATSAPPTGGSAGSTATSSNGSNSSGGTVVTAAPASAAKVVGTANRWGGSGGGTTPQPIAPVIVGTVVTNFGGSTPTGAADGSVSTASPPVLMPANTANPGAIMTLSGQGSTDPACDTISIFRSVDGGNVVAGGLMFWLADIANPPVINGVAGTWSFQDNYADTLLNSLVVAPTAHWNDPPPLGLSHICQHLGRIWGAVGSTVYCSEGPLVGGAGQPPGNAFTGFNPSQYFPFPTEVKRLVPTTNTLLVFLEDSLWQIGGGPNIDTLFPQILLPGYGLSSHDALCVNGGVVYMLTADAQLISLDPNLGVTEIGFPIADQLETFSPLNARLTFLSQGQDKGLFVGDGETGWYKCFPQLAPDAAITGGPVWSPFAVPASQNASAMLALEVTAGQHALLIGGTENNQPILVRDSTFTIFTDNGTAYEANATFGSIVLANPGQLAELGFITAEYQKRGTSPDLLVLMDEISETTEVPFESLAGFTFENNGGAGINLPPQDSPLKYGATASPETLYSNRYWFAQSIDGQVPQPTSCRHLQVQIDFGNDTVENELLTFTIFGRHWQEEA